MARNTRRKNRKRKPGERARVGTTEAGPARSGREPTESEPVAAESEPTESEPAEVELAACALVVELIRSGRIITYIGDILVERVDEVEHPGEPVEAVVIRRFCEVVVPGLVEAETARTLWDATQLVEAARDLIVTDFQLELEAEERRN